MFCSAWLGLDAFDGDAGDDGFDGFGGDDGFAEFAGDDRFDGVNGTCAVVADADAGCGT